MSVHLGITHAYLTSLFEAQAERALATAQNLATRDQELEACTEIGKAMGLFNVMLATVGSDVPEAQRHRWMALKTALAHLRMGLKT